MKTDKKCPNIVLLVLDTHRFDRLSLYGYTQKTSPNIDAFGQQATIFENGISPAQWTIPAHTSMFTGEYPTTHQMTQAHYRLDDRFETLATILATQGYQTTGFCNNPLVGVLNNGLKRGFDKFYNYAGAFPSVPYRSNRLPTPVNRVWEWYTQLFRKWSYPLQNAFAHSDFLFRLSMNPLLVPLWVKYANFKGNTANSLADVQAFLADVEAGKTDDPQFIFINLMETHQPYTPPDKFVHQFVPYFRKNRTLRNFMNKYNYQAFRWNLPVGNNFDSAEAKLINDMYDAEVAYQDHLLGGLLEFLTESSLADDTLTIIVGDHGEGLGEHHFVGHSFVAYQELLHVPFIIRFPAQLGLGERIKTTVSTRRVFHTILDAVGMKQFEPEHRPISEVKALSLARTVEGNDPENETVFAEAYAPGNFLSMMEAHVPELIDVYHCKLNRRAVYQGQQKLARIDGIQDELFDLDTDPGEENDLLAGEPDLVAKLTGKLDAFMVQALARRPDNWEANQTIDLEDDENLMNQLRALGYID